MRNSDVFVLVDDFQYTTQNRINRTQIKSAAGQVWLTVPVLLKGLGNQKINQIKIASTQRWRSKHTKALANNYAYSPYYERYVDEVHQIYKNEWDHLIDLNLRLIDFCRYVLEIKTPICLSSQLVLKSFGQDKVFEIMTKTGCDTYLADLVYKEYLSGDEFAKRDLKLIFSDFVHPTYHQNFGGFISGLSVIDLIFNEGPESNCFV